MSAQLLTPGNENEPVSISYRDPDGLMTEAQAAELIGLTPRFLQARRQRGNGPKYVKVSERCVRYRRRDIIAWMKERIRGSTADS